MHSLSMKAACLADKLSEPCPETPFEHEHHKAEEQYRHATHAEPGIHAERFRDRRCYGKPCRHGGQRHDLEGREGTPLPRLGTVFCR